MKNRQTKFGQSLTGRSHTLDPDGLAAGWLRSEPSTGEQMALAIAISLCLHVMLVGTAGLRAPYLGAFVLEADTPIPAIVWPEDPSILREKTTPPADPKDADQPPQPEVVEPRQPWEQIAPTPVVPFIPEIRPWVPFAEEFSRLPLQGGTTGQADPAPESTGSGGNPAAAPKPFLGGTGGEAGFFPPPPYPPAAERDGEMGTVRIQWRVTPEGNITELKVVGSSGHSRLDQSVLNTVRSRWQFNPGPPRWFKREFEFKAAVAARK